ncbi:MAG: cation:proton antiporter [Spirochaetaceae bacterium]|nr:MAG: cation:proton antiporter [Spirochaetaceae bacterium]
MIEIAGYVLIGVGLAFSAIGIYSVLFYEDFYARVVITSKVDTMGLITVLFGVMLVSGSWSVALKLLLLLVFDLMTGPLATTGIAHSAYQSGYRIKREFGHG